jgi:hypothetical protein
MLIDLHIHTNCSDGSLTPFEIIDEAKKNGLNTISITDHDTVESYTEKLVNYANKCGIELIRGIEISTKTKRCGIHVLGYNIDINNKEFNNKLSKLRNARHDYLYKVSSKIEELGYIINTKELDKIDSVTKAHIALDIINNKNNKEKLQLDFGHIPSKGEFIETIMNEGCPAYVKKETITPKEAANLIRSAGGKVVLAHPVAYFYEDNLTVKDIQSLIDDMNPDGIEAYYIYIDRNGNKHNDINTWLELAKKNNKFVTIGSDFHTKDNIHPVIGLIGEDIKLNDNISNNLKKDS